MMKEMTHRGALNFARLLANPGLLRSPQPHRSTARPTLTVHSWLQRLDMQKLFCDFACMCYTLFATIEI